MNTDLHQRNVLLGLYAHELMGVAASALSAAMASCQGDVPQSVLEALLARGALTRAQVDAIEAYLETQLERNGSLAQLLAEANVETGLARALHRGEGSAHDSTILLSQSQDDEETGRDHADSVVGRLSDSTSSGGRFEKSRFHAAGGLGQVFEAKDIELNRVVALKEIKEEFADNQQNKLRFAKEAEITARLEHPGIVPVYGMGVREDGRLFYAMRFIRGKSLKDAVIQFHQTDWRTKTEGEYNVALRSLLQRFIDACQAIYFAHRRGVIHRDLKPSNIMLGEYGETLVVDWGLAKPLGLRDESTLSQMPLEHTLRTESGSSRSDTQLGHAVGSPSYMSPEQARGAHDMVDFRSDIYGLGATLFAILTGRPPVDGTEDFVTRVITGDIDRPRAVNRRVPKPLEAICLRALAFDPVNRYQTVRALIEDVERYLADEPIAAYSEGITDRISRWSKKNRGLLFGSVIGSLGIATACLALFAVSSAKRQLAERESRVLSEELSALVEMQNDLVLSTYTADVRPKSKRDAKTRQHVDRLIKQSRRIESSIRDPINKAIALEKIAIHLRLTGDLDSAGEVAQRALDLIEHLPQPPTDKLNRIRATYANVLYDQGKHEEAIKILDASLDDQAAQPEQLAARLNALAANYYGLSRFDESAKALRRVVRIRDDQSGPLATATLAAKNNLAMAIAGTSESLNLLQNIVKVVSTDTWDDLSFRMTATANLAYVHALRGENEQALQLFNSAWNQRRRHYGELHVDTMTDLLNLASVERRLGLYPCAEADYETVVSLRTEELGPSHLHTLFAKTGLGKTRLHQDRAEAAAIPLEPAYTGLLAQKGANHPWVNEARELYCYACLASGQWDAARDVIAQWQAAASDSQLSLPATEATKADLAAAELACAERDLDSAAQALPGLAEQCQRQSALAAYRPGVLLMAAQLVEDSAVQREQLVTAADQLAKQRSTTPPQLRHWLPRAYELLEELDRQSGDEDSAAEWAKKRAVLNEQLKMTPEDCARAKSA